MDAVRGNYGYTTRETTPRREVQRADLVEKVRKAAPAEAMSEAEVEQLTAYYNSTLRDVDEVRRPKYPQDLSPCFPWDPEEAELRDKLHVRIQDNSTAREVKDEYRQLLNDIDRESNQAQKMVEKLGPGTHTLSNGDVVEVSQDEGGNVEVSTKSPDGSLKRVFYNTENPTDVRIQATSADHEMRETVRSGQDLTQTRAFKVVTSYSLEDDAVVRVQRGPAYDDYTKTTVNPDGSTDTRELIYISDEPGPDAGDSVFEDTHQPGRFGRGVGGKLSEALGGAVTGGVGRGVGGGFGRGLLEGQTGEALGGAVTGASAGNRVGGEADEIPQAAPAE